MIVEEWFKIKKYPHIGKPIRIQDYLRVKNYIKNRDKIARHSFLPFLCRSIVKRKYRADKNRDYRTKHGERIRRVGKPKNRGIFYSSHLDSLICSYYNNLLVKKYEERLKQFDFSDCVVAYRKIPVTSNSKSNKCNIDFAKSVFSFIKMNSQNDLSIIVSDITSFFDNLDHSLLKKNWSYVLGSNTLPNDHYNLFKYLTKIKYVYPNRLFNSFGKKMIVERGVENDSKRKTLKYANIRKLKYAKEKGAVSFCYKEDFIGNKLNLIKSLKNLKGIPQGTSISSTLANIYMFNFDKEVYKYASNVGGFYQRYSDDIIIVCNTKYEKGIINFLRNRIEEKEKLEIHKDKTKIYRTIKSEDKFKIFSIDEKTEVFDFNNNLEYLGFVYDGNKVLIKNSGFSKFHRNMKRALKRSKSLAIYSKNPDRRIFKSKLYKRFTHKGSKRRLKFKRSKSNKNIYVKSKEYHWGNYLSYVYKADNSMLNLNNNENCIKRQSRKIWNRFNNLLKDYEKEVNKKNKCVQHSV